eukprot:TRINITY_DN7934_c1_g1_i3.p1 TRINITY_DN7934_c1_g1~~TRINITY_DN7934_c1_g1_i3.p1  ORF type:complete len:233 (+),score=-0.53 TRINITY_DN7934_c1_g1_i3:335-1033(+)
MQISIILKLVNDKYGYIWNQQLQLTNDTHKLWKTPPMLNEFPQCGFVPSPTNDNNKINLQYNVINTLGFSYFENAVIDFKRRNFPLFTSLLKNNQNIQKNQLIYGSCQTDNIGSRIVHHNHPNADTRFHFQIDSTPQIMSKKRTNQNCQFFQKILTQNKVLMPIKLTRKLNKIRNQQRIQTNLKLQDKFIHQYHTLKKFSLCKIFLCLKKLQTRVLKALLIFSIQDAFQIKI